MARCANCGIENPDVARFCLACGAQLAEPEAPAEERKVVTAVFTDLVGSTARSEQLDPEDVKALVKPYHERVRAELERHGGTFEKFSGDAVLALFGAPQAHEDDPERAVRAALSIREALRELNAADEWLDLHFRIGINTGEALVMLDARPTEGEWSAAGDVMNTAARIESAAAVDGVLVGEQTYRATRHAFEYRTAEPVAAKGKAEPVRVWEVVDTKDGTGPRPLSELELIGRETELEELLVFCEEMLERQRAAVATVIGAPGIGKSRLLIELTQRLRERCNVHIGRCLSYGEGITYWPVEEVLKDAAGIHHGDDGPTASAKLGVLLESLGTTDRDELRTIAAAVANLLGAETTPQGTYSTTEITQAELHWGIRRLLELLAARRPTVVVLEDLHWAEPTLLELIGFVGESRAEAPLLVLGSARPEAKEAEASLFRSDGNRRALELDALTSDASASLVASVAGRAGLSPEAVEAVLSQAGGNPLFIEETVRMLAEGGGASDEERGLAVPDSLQALIASRLDQLQLPVKRLAHNASVIGLAFWPGAVAHLSEGTGDLEGGLDSLERRDLIRRNATSSMARELEYVFKHILIRDVAYGQLTKSRRSALHARFAEWLEALTGGEDDLVEFVAYHFEQACLIAGTIARPEKPPPVDAAIEALVRAAEKAERREGTAEANRFYERALAIAGDDRPEAVVDIRLRRCRILFAQGEFPRAQEQLAEVAEEAGRLGRLDVRCGALVVLANIAQIQGRPAESRRVLAEAEPLAAEIDDRRLQIRAAYTSAYVRGWAEGDVSLAVEELRRAGATAVELGDRALRIEGHFRTGALLFNVGDLAGAEEELARGVTLGSELGSHRDEARGTSSLAFIRYYRGDIEEAERLALQAREWLDRTCDSHVQIQNLRNMAKYALARDDPELAEQRLREALPVALESGGWLVIELYRYLVETLVRQGRLDDAADLLAFAARNVPEDDAYARAALLLAEAIVATAALEQAAATTSFAEALRLLEEQQLVIDLAEARIALARSLRTFGDVAGARTELERARATFAGMGARTLLDEIDRELAVLTAGAGGAGPRWATS